MTIRSSLLAFFVALTALLSACDAADLGPDDPGADPLAPSCAAGDPADGTRCPDAPAGARGISTIPGGLGNRLPPILVPGLPGADTNCGLADQACCWHLEQRPYQAVPVVVRTCDQGTCDASHICRLPTPCGEVGQRCCVAGGGCSNPNSYCAVGNNTCVACGSDGQWACAVGALGHRCLPGATVVVEHGQYGDSYKCKACGGDGQIACADPQGANPFCNAGFTVAGGLCAPCGKLIQRACHDSSGDHCEGSLQAMPGYVNHELTTICNVCGQLGQDACPQGAACANGLERGNGGKCVLPWGRDGQRCDAGACRSDLGCYGGTCEPRCGHTNEECCYTHTGGLETRSVCRAGLYCGAQNYHTICTGTPTPPTPPTSPAGCNAIARAHATSCTNATDGTPSYLSHSICADACGTTLDQAKSFAQAALSQQTCLGDGWGCCEVVVDQDFNACGK
jgi:hypothetical protein